MLDLLRLKDELNLKKMNADGSWEATDETSSSLLLNSLLTSQQQFKQREIDNLTGAALKEEEELGKLQKLVGKYSTMIKNIENDEKEALNLLSIL